MNKGTNSTISKWQPIILVGICLAIIFSLFFGMGQAFAQTSGKIYSTATPPRWR